MSDQYWTGFRDGQRVAQAAIDGVAAETARLGVEECQRLRARVVELERVLRMVKADRPSAHSDRVWEAIQAALDGPEVPGKSAQSL